MTTEGIDGKNPVYQERLWPSLGQWIFALIMTSSLGIRDDLTNAGALWVDEPAVVDGNIVSARVPKDLPAFTRAMLGALGE